MVKIFCDFDEYRVLKNILLKMKMIPATGPVHRFSQSTPGISREDLALGI